MTIETELKSLVELYATFNPKLGCYFGVLNEDKRARLERSFNQLLLKWLLQNGPEKEQIVENYQKLAPSCEIKSNYLLASEVTWIEYNKWLLQGGPEKEPTGENYQKFMPFFEAQTNNLLPPEIIWIEYVLSNSTFNGTCSKLLSLNYQKLISPENFKTIKFNEIVTREDLKKWLEGFKKQAVGYTEQSFYESLINLVNESGAFYDEVGKINIKGIKVLLSFLPMVVVSIGTVAFAEELFAVYALYFVLLKGGQLISKGSAAELKAVGNALQKISTVTATTTTTMLVRLVEMIFFASLQCYATTLQLGSVVLAPLTSNASELITPESLEQDLINANQSKHVGIAFKNYQLKLIASPIEARVGLLAEQYFLSYRVGKSKLHFMKSLLDDMRELDQNSDPIEVKLEGVHDLLDRIKRIKVVYTSGGQTTLAIDKAEGFLRFLQKNPLAFKSDDSLPTVTGDLSSCELDVNYFSSITT